MKLQTRLPLLTYRLDCAGLAPEYAGIVVVVRLNPDFPAYTVPDPSTGSGPEVWQTEVMFRRARFVQRVLIPGRFTDDGQDVEVAIDQDPLKLYELETAEGFDPRITQWATTQVILRREELWQARLKN